MIALFYIIPKAPVTSSNAMLFSSDVGINDNMHKLKTKFIFVKLKKCSQNSSTRQYQSVLNETKRKIKFSENKINLFFPWKRINTIINKIVS